jgi:hypothetical protein
VSTPGFGQVDHWEEALRRMKVHGVAMAMLAAALLIVNAAAALAAPPSQDIGTSGGPLNKIAIGNELSCQLQHVGDTTFEFYPSGAVPGSCGTFVAVDATLFAPDFSNHDGSATGGLGTYTPFTPVSQTAVTGTGAPASPRKVVTVADVGSSGLRITETDTYVNGRESYRTDVAVANTGSGPKSGTIYRAGDCYLQNTDNGFGFTGSPNGSVGCAENANNTPAGRIEQWVPVTPGSSFTEDVYNQVWSKIATQMPFANDCVHCADQVDNGAGLSWSFNIAGGQTATFSHHTVFSPTGVTGPPPPPVEGPAGNPLGLPPNKKCVDTRKFSFKLHHPTTDPITDVKVFINGKRKMHKTAAKIERLTLKKLPKKKFKVRIVATRVSGVKSISVRTYRGCKKGRVKTHGVHPH